MPGAGEGSACQGGLSPGLRVPGASPGQTQRQDGDTGPTHRLRPAQGVSGSGGGGGVAGCLPLTFLNKACMCVCVCVHIYACVCV